MSLISTSQLEANRVALTKGGVYVGKGKLVFILFYFSKFICNNNDSHYK